MHGRRVGRVGEREREVGGRPCVADEDVVGEGGTLRALGDESGSVRRERDHLPVGVDRRSAAVEVALLAVAADADTARRAGLAVAHEDVEPEVGVVADEIRRERRERDEAPVGADHRRLPVVVVLCAGVVDALDLAAAARPIEEDDRPRRDGRGAVVEDDEPAVGADLSEITLLEEVRRAWQRADRLEHAAVEVAQEDLHGRVRVAAQVGGEGVEDDDVPVPVQIGRERPVVALRPVRSVADAHGCPRRAVVHEDVLREVGVGLDEVVGEGAEGDAVAVAADRRMRTVAVALRAVARDAVTLDRAGQAVVHENVDGAVRVALDEVRGLGVEGDVAAVGADRRPAHPVQKAAVAVRLRAAAADADALSRPGQPVADKDVGDAVRVARDEVVGKRDEGDEAAVGAHSR